MGALHGHLMHPHENLDLRFRDLKVMFYQIANGDLDSACEKFDGQNIFLHVDSSGTTWFARNLSDVKGGKVAAGDIDNRFAGRGPVHTAFNDAALTASKIFSSWDSEKIKAVFGDNTWYSAEIIHTANPNVIKYDTCALIFHWDGTGSRDPITGHAISSKAQASAFNKATVNLDKVCESSGLCQAATLKEYIAKNIRKDFLDSLNLSSDCARLVMMRMFDEEGSLPAPSITKGMRPGLKASLRDVMKKRKNLREDYLAPITETIREVSNLALSGTSSNLVSIHEKELARIQDSFDSAVEFVENSNDYKKLGVLNKNKDQLQSRDQITSSQEGVVFKFDGNSYKLTGKFAPLNQILGQAKDWSK